MKPGDIVICVDSSNSSRRLTTGKKYTLIQEIPRHTGVLTFTSSPIWKIVLDDGFTGRMYIHRFISLSEYRTRRIDELLK